MLGLGKKMSLPTSDEALPGRNTLISVTNQHHVHGRPIQGPFADNFKSVIFGMGCFWGAERRFWQVPEVYTTAVGYAQGLTPNPSYEEVCSGLTGHNEVVLVVFDPKQISLASLLKTFWESHDPTQGMQQGGDRGTQYRSGVYATSDHQLAEIKNSLTNYQSALSSEGKGTITTEADMLDTFYYAEDYHQQYLSKNPQGYCGLGGTGVCYTD